MKKTLINIFIILFLISVYKDLTTGTTISDKNVIKEKQTEIMDKQTFEVIKVKIESGDTVLTIVERLNPNISNFNIDHILQDFTSLNPNVNPEQLKLNRFYFFPKYKQ